MNKKPGYIIIGYADYMKIALSEILNDSNVQYHSIEKIARLKYCVYRIISLLHRRIPFIHIPFFIFHWLYRFKNICSYTSLYIILYEKSHFSINISFLNYLKGLHPNVKIVFIFTNTFSSKENIKELSFVDSHRSVFDVIITFNEVDAKSYGFTFFDQVCSPSNIFGKSISKSDIYFCGFDKGRKELIGQIEKKMKSCGVICDFNIPTNDEWIPYDVILSKLGSTNCVLEVLEDTNQSGSTLRSVEAIANKKKLLTNNAYIKTKKYYNSKQISYFSSIDDIDIPFVKECIKDSDCVDPKIVSPKGLLDFLEENTTKI